MSAFLQVWALPLSACLSAISILTFAIRASVWFGRTQAVWDALLRGHDRMEVAIRYLADTIAEQHPVSHRPKRMYDDTGDHP